MAKKIFITGLLILLLCGGFYYANNKKVTQNDKSLSTAQDNKVRLIFSNDIEDFSFLTGVARDKGFYKKNNVDVVDVLAPKDFTNLLLSGEGDVTLGTYTATLAAYYNNAETRVLANLFRPFVQFGISRFPRGQEKSIKKVAVQTLTGDPINMMNTTLKSFGVDPASVEITAVASSQARLAMLKNSETDFIMFSSQTDMKMLSDNTFTIYQPGDMISRLEGLRTISTTQNVINKKSAAIGRFVNAIDETLKYVDNNHEEVVSYLQQKNGWTQDQAEDFYQWYIGGKKNVSFVPSVEAIPQIIENTKKISGATTFRDIDAYFYPKFAQDAELNAK